MRHLLRLNRFLGSNFSPALVQCVKTGCILGVSLGSGVVNATLQVTWESPVGPEPRVLKSFELPELENRKLATLQEIDPLVKGESAPARFQGVSLAAVVEEATKTFTAADRSTTDLVVLKARTGREVLMPKAFLIKYPQIQIAFRKNAKSLGSDAPRIILPVLTSTKIQHENILLDPLFISALSSITLSSYEKRYGAFFLQRRTDPAAMRREKLLLQNCVTCHTQPAVAMAALTSSDKIRKMAQGEHPVVTGNSGFKTIFDAKAIRSLVSYLEAFRFQTAKN